MGMSAKSESDSIALRWFNTHQLVVISWVSGCKALVTHLTLLSLICDIKYGTRDAVVVVIKH